MKIKDLDFNFLIGNTFGGTDVMATNNGLYVGNEISSYNGNETIETAEDLKDAINEAIFGCGILTSDEKEELSMLLYNDAAVEIDYWWRSRYE